tara:strand:+ start:802 stop:1182 length:381 start_codon:yes stop_codon:yes gene_type:complete
LEKSIILKMKINSIQKFNTVNSISLFSMSIWGYIDTNSFTALIPLFFGIILFSLGALLNKEKLVKISAHLIVLFTLIILAALSVQVLPGVIERGGVGLLRVLVMIVTSSIAMIVFIKSFIDNRKSS